MLVNLNDILNNVELPTIILIFGEEDLLIENAVDLLLKKALVTETDRFNFDMFDGEDGSSDLATIIDVCRSYPMMSPKRVILVKRFEKFFSGRGTKKFENSPVSKYFENPSPDTFLILTSELEAAKDLAKFMKEGKNQVVSKKISALKYPFNFLIENHKWIEYSKIHESEYPKWIISKFKQLNKTISENAAQLIAAHCRQTLRDIDNEINKLDTFTLDKKSISEDDVLLLVGSTREYNVFELQKAVGERNLIKSVNIMNKMLANDRQEMLILTILTKFFTVLWKLSDESSAGVNPFQLATKVGIFSTHLNEYQSAVKRFSAEDLENCFLVLAETDLQLKSSGTDNLYVMHKMLLNIIQK